MSVYPRFYLNHGYGLLVILFTHNAQRKSKGICPRGRQLQPISWLVCEEEGFKPKYLLLRDVKIAIPGMFIIKDSDSEIIKAHY